ncbi:MAG: hypothetical protein ACREMV_06180 [Gemmatimonadales bacterium]
MRLAWAVLLLLAAVAGAQAPPAAKEARRTGVLDLFASEPLLLDANRVQCNIVSDGEVCTAFRSPVGGGGFWPKGTLDQYIFNSGLQFVAVVEPGVPGFAWSGDTTGAWFFDTRGDQVSGVPLTDVFNSLDPDDAAAWPAGAVVSDPASYHSELIGRAHASQQDSWVRYWEGDTTRLGGRTHPAGVMVEQRSLAWSYPSGNEDVLYFVFTFYNVTASDPAVYANATVPPQVRADLAALGARFQAMNEARFGVAIPAGGYALEDAYVAIAMDPDVARFQHNYATAVLPFHMGVGYTGDFLPEVGWTFPLDAFGAPFLAAPGFVGAKFVRSAMPSPGVDAGLTMFSMLGISGAFPHTQGVNLLYRRLSGFLGPGDLQCNPFTDPVVARIRRACWLGQVQRDAIFYQATGPLDLPPGEARTIVVAYVFAAPLDIVQPFVGGDLPPGIPFTGDSIAADGTKVRVVERVAGWVTERDADGDGVIVQAEVTTAPRSLLHKALVAQSMVDHGFLLPAAPAPPAFHLIPDDDQVTVVWQPSATEAAGDPFFAIASQPFDSLGRRNPLYDPNFRQLDVEGYRIYRGRTAATLELIAQLDYAGTTFRDFTGTVVYGDLNGDGRIQCAPEFGLQADCPVTFDTGPPHVTFAERELAGTFAQVTLVQVKVGDRIRVFPDTTTLVLHADSAVVGEASGFPVLANTGVPFAFVDQGVRNSIGYVYAVTAFDVNSLTSGPSSLESPRFTKAVTPRRSASNEVRPTVAQAVFGDDGVALDPAEPAGWTIGANTGRFAGRPPPTGVASLRAVLAPVVPQLLGPLQVTAIVDSVVPRSEADGLCPRPNFRFVCFEFFVSYVRGADTTRIRTAPFWPVIEFPQEVRPMLPGVPVPLDSITGARFGIPPAGADFTASVEMTLRRYMDFSAHENQAAASLSFSGASPGGSRWFSGADETLDHPAYSIRVGRLPGVDTIFAPLSDIDLDPAAPGQQVYSPTFVDGAGFPVASNMRCHTRAIAATGRQADIVVTWAAGGTIASVRDVTHRVNVPFHAIPQAGYGFIPDANGNGMIDWRDFDRMEGVAQNNARIGACAGADPGPANRALLTPQPVIGPVTTEGSNPSGTIAGFSTTGTGFGLYVNGQQFIFQLAGGVPPAAGTQWTLRAYAGVVQATTNAGGTTPSGYTYVPVASSPAIPGLRVVLSVPGRTTVAAPPATILDSVHTVPDPYYVTSALVQSPADNVLKFINLPPQAIIRIYSASGILVAVVVHDDPTFGAEATWDLRSRNGRLVASGVYFYHIETPQRRTKVGRFTILTYKP